VWKDARYQLTTPEMRAATRGAAVRERRVDVGLPVTPDLHARDAASGWRELPRPDGRLVALAGDDERGDDRGEGGDFAAGKAVVAMFLAPDVRIGSLARICASKLALLACVAITPAAEGWSARHEVSPVGNSRPSASAPAISPTTIASISSHRTP
jgi:hypothetical protein